MSVDQRLDGIDTEVARIRAASNRLPGIIRSRAASRTQKVIMLRQVASDIGAAVAPHTICSRGCSACCHQHIVLSELEARVIEKETGARRAAVDSTRGLVGQVREQAEADQRKYLGVPCTFLVDGECSIYEHRPMICRTHFSLADDVKLCDPARGLQVNDLPLYHNEHFAITAGALTLLTPQADIREFFPNGKAP